MLDALIQVPTEEMLERFRKIDTDVKAALPKLTFGHRKETAYLETDWMLEYVYAHLEAFRLIFCRLEGTY